MGVYNDERSVTKRRRGEFNIILGAIGVKIKKNSKTPKEKAKQEIEDGY